MRLKPHDNRDGYKVWLSDPESELLIGKLDERGGTMHRCAGRLGLHCGLRRDEASQTAAVDVTEGLGSDDTQLRVWEDVAKLDKYRETPIPRDLANQFQMIPEFHDDVAQDDPVLGVTGKTLNRWVKRAGEELYAETGDEGWSKISYHDLRRTWGTRLLETGTLPSVVMLWGGWEDWETFREHYLGEFSPHALQRERSKVPWLGGSSEKVDDVESHISPIVQPPGSTNYAQD